MLYKLHCCNMHYPMYQHQYVNVRKIYIKAGPLNFLLPNMSMIVPNIFVAFEDFDVMYAHLGIRF